MIQLHFIYYTVPVVEIYINLLHVPITNMDINCQVTIEAAV